VLPLLQSRIIEKLLKKECLCLHFLSPSPTTHSSSYSSSWQPARQGHKSQAASQTKPVGFARMRLQQSRSRKGGRARAKAVDGDALRTSGLYVWHSTAHNTTLAHCQPCAKARRRVGYKRATATRPYSRTRLEHRHDAARSLAAVAARVREPLVVLGEERRRLEVRVAQVHL